MLTSVRKRWQPLAWAVLFTVLAVNAWIQSGLVALVIVALAGVGCAVLVAAVATLAGASAAHHSLKMEQAVRAVEASRRARELTR